MKNLNLDKVIKTIKSTLLWVGQKKQKLQL